ncbi:MAG: phospholipase A2 [Meiothermus sp.]|nr:phospholipase A2 [Meiothermus sp.]
MLRVWLLGMLLLVACSQAPQAVQTEPSGAQILEEMRQLGVEREAIAAYEQALQNVEAARAGIESLALSNLQLVQVIGLGTVATYNSYYTARSSYPQFNWVRDGCSAPSGLGLGYRETFRPACNVHDFAYRNFPSFPTLATETGRKAADDSFLVNMNRICAGLGFFSRGACYSAAFAYYSAVRLAGWAYF